MINFNLKDVIVKFILSLLLGIIVISIIFLLNDTKNIVNIFDKITTRGIFILFICSVLIYFGRFLKWCVFLRALKIKLPLIENIKIFLSGLSMGLTPGKLGEILKSYILKKKYRIDFSLTAPTVFVERLTGVIGCFILCMITSIMLNEGNIYSYVFFILMITVVSFIIIVFKSPKCFQYILDKISNIKFLVKKIDVFRNFYEGMLNLLNIKIFFICINISILYWGMESILFYNILKAFNVDIDVINSIFMITSISIIGGLSFMPGSLGTLEGGLIAVLVYKGISFDLASVITILHRFFAMWLIIIIGAVILILNVRNFQLYK